MCGEINNTIFDLHWTFNIISASAYGVLAPGSAHARPSAQPPIDTSRISRRTCLQSHLQTSPPPLKTHISKPYNNSFLVKIIFFFLGGGGLQNCTPRRQGGSPNFSPHPKSFFLTYNSVQNYKTLAQPLLGEKCAAQKEKEKLSHKYFTLRSASMPKDSTCTLLGPISSSSYHWSISLSFLQENLVLKFTTRVR
jgi:hypothetical protein